MHSPVSPRVRALAWLLALAFPAASAAAQPPWDGPAFTAAPAEVLRAAAAAAPDPGESVVVLLTEASYSYDDAGRETFTQRVVYRIVGAGAHESWSAVEEQWSPWHQERPLLRARVISPDGQSHSLDPAVLTENGVSGTAPDLFEDDRVLRGPLPATGPGAVVEQQVTKRDKQPFFDAGVVRYHGLRSGVAVRRARLTLEAPAGSPLSWVARGLGQVAPKETVAAGRRKLVFEVTDLAAAEMPEPGLPPEVPSATYVAFATGGSWNAVARRYSAIVDQAMAGADLSGLLRAAGNPGLSQLEIVDRLLDKIGSEVRYTGLELGAGGLIPRRPGDTLKRKFGDCKDKAVLLTALLRALDIPAYVALLSAGEGESDVEPALPGLGAFNHAIVMVPGNPPVWIDPTDRFARAGELPVGDQGRLALVASPTATELVRTPESVSTDNREVETREITLAELGKGRLIESDQYWGAPERDLRAYYASSDPQALRDHLTEYMKEVYQADAVHDVAPGDPGDLSRPFSIRLQAEGIGSAVTDLREAVVAIDLTGLLSRLPDELTAQAEAEEEPVARTADYVFSRPFVIEDVYRITPPEGFAPQPLPASRTRRIGSATLSEEYAAEPSGVVVAKVRFDSGKRRLTAAELAAYTKEAAALADEDSVLVKFEQVGEGLLAAGKVPEALAELGRLAAGAPKKALPRSRLGRALLAGGMAEAARQEAQRAVALEPNLAVAWRNLGWILEHDLLGRHRQPGFDLAGAVAAYRKAVALDPDDAVARASLAILLEHNAAGERYGPGSDLAAAIVEYKAVAFEQLTAEFQPNLLVALLRAGRPEEVKAEAARLAASSTRSILEIVATGMTGGADAALAQAERTFPDAGARVPALASAAQTLASLRRYGEAAALLERAGRQAAKPAELLARAELLRKVRPAEAAGPAAASSPAAPARAFVAALFERPFAPASLVELFSKSSLPGADMDVQEGFAIGLTIGLAPLRKAFSTGEVSSEVARDLFLALATERVEGDEATGFRVKLEVPYSDDELLTFFVQPEEGTYRISALSTVPETIGTQALLRAQRGDVAAARRWLEWGAAELAAGDAGDPLDKPPVLSLWTAGEEAPPEAVRCAAAALAAADAISAAAARPVLESCRAAETEPARQAALDLALADAAQAEGRWEDVLTTSRKLFAAYPASARAFLSASRALTELTRNGELAAMAKARLAEKPGDPDSLRILAQLAQDDGRLDEADAFFDQLQSGGKAEAGDFNNRAWLALARGKADEQAAEWARRATTLSGYQSSSSLHTLAAIYAEQGKTSEAYRVLIESLEVKPDGTPETHDWYVLGRLAEHYGLPGEAQKYYRQASAEGGPTEPATSTWALAARRLAVLGKK